MGVCFKGKSNHDRLPPPAKQKQTNKQTDKQRKPLRSPSKNGEGLVWFFRLSAKRMGKPIQNGYQVAKLFFWVACLFLAKPSDLLVALQKTQQLVPPPKKDEPYQLLRKAST